MTANSKIRLGKNQKSRSQYKRSLRLESLEERALLSVTPLSSDEYADLRAQYADFNLPEDMADLNVITLDLAEGNNLSTLRSAISTAGSTAKSDLIVVRTNDTANTIKYTDASDELLIIIDSTTKGSVTIVGLGSKPFTLDANQQCRVMAVYEENTVVNLGGLTITNGKSNYGGGIYLSSGTLSVINCTISENTTESSGGGIDNYEGTLTIANSTIAGNTAEHGAGIDNYEGTLTVTNSTISGNTASYDGGISNNFSTLTVTNSTISGNTSSSGNSGGISNFDGTLTVTNSTIAGNTSQFVGGIFNHSGELTVTNSMISGNTASSSAGGGIDNYRGALTVTNCTIVGNTDPYGTANGIYNDSDSQKVTINNSIVIDSIVKRSGKISGSNNLSTYAGFSSRFGNLTYDSSKPLFVDAANGDYHLIVGSQAIDKGNNALAVDANGQALAYDLDGRPRIMHGKVDIGAYESTLLSAPTLSAAVKQTTVTFSWDADPYASGYDFQYRAEDGDWISELVNGTSFSFEGSLDKEYMARVMALGTDDYTDSEFSETLNITVQEIVPVIEGKKVTVNWVDDSPAADSVRYRVAGTTKWTTKKLKAGVTTFTFNGAVGTDYEIEVLLDQQEVKVFQTTAVVLDQPKLKADKAAIQDDTFQVSVTNYAAKNLADNATQALVTVNGVQTVVDITDQQGAAVLENGGNVAFSNGLFTFTDMNSNTQYKVQVAFTDGLSVSTASSNLSVKTTKAPYLAPMITYAVANSDTSVEVMWETTYGKNSTTPAQKYTIQYSLDGVKWSNATTGATGNIYTIQKLKGGNLYQVRVLATKDNKFNASDPSYVLATETLATPKVVVVKNSVTSSSFQIQVTNYYDTNLVLARTLKIKLDKYGEKAISLEDGVHPVIFSDGMTATFRNDTLTFENAPANTQLKIQLQLSNGFCTTAWTSAVSVKTAKAA